MEHLTKREQYLEEVSSCVRWKKAHPVIMKELNDHMTDQKEALTNSGMTAAEAEDEAVFRMGDAREVGEKLNKAYCPETNWGLFIPAVMLLIFCIVVRIIETMNYKDFYGEIYGLNRDDWQGAAIALAVGATVFVIMYFFDLRFVVKYIYGIYAGYIMFIWYGLIALPTVNGRTPVLSYVFLFFPVLLAGIIYRNKRAGLPGFLKIMVLAFIPVCFAAKHPSMSSLFLLLGSSGVLIIYAVWSNWFAISKKLACMITLLPFAAGGVYLFVNYWQIEYFRERLQVLFRIGDMDRGYMFGTIKKILSEAVFIGKGGGSYDLYELIPDATGEFMITNLIYQYGWIILVFIIATVGMITIQGIKITRMQKSFWGRLMSLAVVLIFLFQSSFSIAGNLGMVALMEIPLPFMSGSYTFCLNIILIGIWMSLHRNNIYTSAYEGERKIRIMKRETFQ